MEKGSKDSSKGIYNSQEFMVSDVELGILSSEVFRGNVNRPIKLIVFNRLDMILELNDKVLAN